MNHWFDGLAMLHRFEVDAGAVTYASRFLETKAYRAARDEGEIRYSEFATDPCRTLFSRVAAMFSPKLSDNGNVNLAKLGERFVAMTETPIPVEFDGETLATAGVAYEVPGMLTTAHPHLDRPSGGMLNYAAKLGPRNQYRFFLVGPDADQPEVIASLPVREPAYMHSFGLTERWIVLAENPFVVNPLGLAFSGRPYIENYRWKPELGTRFTLVDRSTGEALGPFETEPFFCFHHVNAYEEDGSVVADLCHVSPTRARSRTSTSTACAPASRSRRRSCAAAGSRSSRDRSKPSCSPTRASTCRGSTTGAATSGTTATSGAPGSATQAGSTGS